jgi:hypothetical protein
MTNRGILFFMCSLLWYPDAYIVFGKLIHLAKLDKPGRMIGPLALLWSRKSRLFG